MHCSIIYSMKALTNIILIVALLLGGMIYLGYISVDQLKDLVLGEVTMGETKHKYTEADFKQVFDLIVGEVEVTDTSSTAFERNNPLCDKAYVLHTADALLKYEVKTTDDLFFVDVDNMTYFISDKLGVTYYETNRNNQMAIKESNCIKARDIKSTDILKNWAFVKLYRKIHLKTDIFIRKCSLGIKYSHAIKGQTHEK